MFGHKASRTASLADPRLQAAFDLLPDAISYWDAGERICFWNRTYAERVKVSGAQLRIGMPYLEMLQSSLDRGVFPEAAGREAEFVQQRLAQRRAGQTFERKLSEDRWWRFDERVTPDGGILSTIVDITELKRKEAALEAKEAQNAEANATIAAASEEQRQIVEQLALGLDRLASGELQFRLSTGFPPSYEKLRGDFNAAMQRLHDTMDGIALSARGVHSGAEEISQAAEDLSRRTEHQAASLEETAAALDEITATVRRTADGANHASIVVASAKAEAELSGTVTSDAIVAMGQIESSARQISQIIGVIDEIAFQTNLLALNAGVEAARAGDAGRGFAVVASEVRALAQRSAEAAKEIKALIPASTQQVSEGVDLVGRAGEALRLIAGKVSEVDSLVGDIAAAAQEQSTGLAEVNTAVNQMDQVVQQNAAMVEESAAATATLKTETGKLIDLVERFQVTAANAEDSAWRAQPPTRRALRVAGGGGSDSWEEF